MVVNKTDKNTLDAKTIYKKKVNKDRATMHQEIFTDNKTIPTNNLKVKDNLIKEVKTKFSL